MATPVDAQGNPLVLGGTTPTATPAAPGAVDPVTGMPLATAVGTTSKSKTFGGVPVDKFPHGPIDVPGFTAPGLSREDQTGRTQIPNYTDGDQWAPASDPDPDVARHLQIQLINAGLLTLKSVHLGIWDTNSASAYAKVLAHANLSGVPASVAMDEYVKSAAALPQKAINPDDLNALANQVAQNTLGRNLHPDELAKFGVAFQAALAQEGPDNGPQTAAGLQSLGQGILTKEHPREAAATNLHLVSQHAVQILSGPSNPLTKITP